MISLLQVEIKYILKNNSIRITINIMLVLDPNKQLYVINFDEFENVGGVGLVRRGTVQKQVS